MPKGAWIRYGDVAPEAKENFTPTASEKAFDTLGNLQKYNMRLYNYANPCEMYQTLLDGSAEAFPDNAESANIGLWSEQLSGEDGTFAEPITLTLESEGQYSSQGFTFTFDKFNDIYATKLNIKWYRVTSEGIELLSDMDFAPSSSFYFCRNKIENFNKVVITFYSLNMPKNRLKVEAIDYGYGTVFTGADLRNVKLAQYLDPISSEIKINTCDFTLDSHTDMEYSFQAKQPLTIGFNDRTLITSFVKSSKRKARFLWDVTSEDYIGILETTPYVGGMYAEIAAETILEDIFTVAKVPYRIAEELRSVPVSGHIPYTTCREALMQVCFAIGAVADTTDENNIDVVYIKALKDEVAQTIPLSRIMQGQNFEAGSTVTRVELAAHTYAPLPLADRDYLYKAADSGAGENILVKFSEPQQVDTIEISGGEILEKGANYAIINANASCQLWGQGYKHTTQTKYKRNETVLASEADNVIPITEATLISANNVDKILQRCYEWLTRVDSTNLKIIEGKDVTRETHTVKWGEKPWGTFKWGETIIEETVTEQKAVHLGDVLSSQTEYLGDVTGRLIQQSFNLNGNIIVKEAVLK